MSRRINLDDSLSDPKVSNRLREQRKRELEDLTQLTNRLEVPGFVASESTSKLPASPLPNNENEDFIIPAPKPEDPAERRRARRKQLRDTIREGGAEDGATALDLSQLTGPAGQHTLESTSALDGTSQHQGSEQPGRLLRRKRGGTRSTRFDKQDSSTIDPLQTGALTSSGGSAMHSPIKALNAAMDPRDNIPFFTSPIKDSDSTPAAVTTEDPHPVVSESDIQATDVDEAVVKEEPVPEVLVDEQLNFVDHLGNIIEGGDVWVHVANLTVPSTSEYVPFRKRLASERKVIHSIPDQHRPFNIANPAVFLPDEDDGFFSGFPLQGTSREHHNFEYRIATDHMAEKWFSSDGTLMTLPNPLKLASMRPESLLEAEVIKLQRKDLVEFHSPTMSTFTLQSVSSPMNANQQYLLEIDVSSIVLTNHPLFTPEHDVASKISNLYHQYLLRSKIQASQHLTNRLRSLKESESRLLQIIERSSALNDSLRFRQQTRLRDYRHEIRQTRQQRDEEDRVDTLILEDIINAWHQLKTTRTQQQYSSTPIGLVIFKQEMSKEEDKAAYLQDLKEELQEREDLYNEMQAAKHEQLRILRLQEQRDRDLDGSLVIPNLDDLPEELRQPFDRELVRREIIERFKLIKRRAGDPKLRVEMSFDRPVTPFHECPQYERDRRTQMKNYLVYVRVVVNSKEVSRTKTAILEENFMLMFGDSFQLKIATWPFSIVLQVWETHDTGDILVSELFLDVPAASAVRTSSQLASLDFASDRVLRFDFSDNSRDSFLSGTMRAMACWGTDSRGIPLHPPVVGTAAVQSRPAQNAAFVPGLFQGLHDKSWMKNTVFDPNDPRNAQIARSNAQINLITFSHDIDYFRLNIDNQSEETLRFDEDIPTKERKRDRLLRLRFDEVPDYKHYSLVPQHERDIPDSLFDALDQKKTQPLFEDIMPSHLFNLFVTRLEMDPHAGGLSNFLREVRAYQVSLQKSVSKQLQTDDVVAEEALPDISTLSQAISDLFAPNRPLRPRRRHRKVAATGTPDHCRLLVRIVRAVDIPSRSKKLSSGLQSAGRNLSTLRTLEELNAATSSDSPKIELDASVRPFVEVTFQRQTKCTSVSVGSSPSWNEEISLAFVPPNNDFSPDLLQNYTAEICLNLFDEVIIDALSDERRRDTNVQQRREKRFLGSLSIPFSTVFLNQRIEGSFKVNVPLSLFGYDRQNLGAPTPISNHHTISNATDTYLTIFITLDPALKLPYEAQQLIDTNESTKLIQYSKHWKEEFEASHPSRNGVVTLTQDINGFSVFVTRYIHPQVPPPEIMRPNEPLITNLRRLARFVSQIPFLSDTEAFVGSADLWTTSDQFFMMLGGDYEEHAILLCNYFLAAGAQAWLVLGQAIPEGETAYVLTNVNDELLVWNAVGGDSCDPTDYFCPLRHIHCLLNEKNIWANIQKHDAPYQMRFNLDVPKDWKPFFSPVFPSIPLTTVQIENIRYDLPDLEKAAELQSMIEETLSHQIETWRERHVTRWNRYCMATLRESLKEFEEFQILRRPHLPPSITQILQTHEMLGFPLNMPFSNIDRIIDAVFNTGVHKSEDPFVEFALAAYVHPYPNNVHAVWVYVATIRSLT